MGEEKTRQAVSVGAGDLAGRVWKAEGCGEGCECAGELRHDFEIYAAGLFAVPLNVPFTDFGRAMAARSRLLDKIGGLSSLLETSATTRLNIFVHTVFVLYFLEALPCLALMGPASRFLVTGGLLLPSSHASFASLCCNAGRVFLAGGLIGYPLLAFQ